MDQLEQPQQLLVETHAVRLRRYFRRAFSISFVLALFMLALFAYGIWLKNQSPTYIRPGKVESARVSEYIPVELPEPSMLEQKIRQPNLGEIEAVSIYAYNPATSQTYVEQNIDQKVQIASITKLLSAKLFLEKFSSDELIELKQPYGREMEHVLGIEVGDKIPFEDALHAMLISSYNDAAFTLAYSYPGGYQQFLADMNLRARQLGMADSHFDNPAGYDSPENYSTARDLRKLVDYILKDQFILDIVNTRRSSAALYKVSGAVKVEKLESTNKLFGEDLYVKGLKTGYTSGAKQCFIGYFDAGEDDRLITIILGAEENRFEETTSLLEEIRGSFR